MEIPEDPDPPDNVIGGALERIVDGVDFTAALGANSVLAETHRHLADVVTTGLSDSLSSMVEPALAGLHADLTAPGGPLDFGLPALDLLPKVDLFPKMDVLPKINVPMPKFEMAMPAVDFPKPKFEGLLPEPAPVHSWMPEEIDFDDLLGGIEPPARDASIRELLEETRAESTRNRERWEASEAARAEERRQAAEDRQQADADRAAETRRYRWMLLVTAVSGVATGAGALLAAIAL